ncbi:uncharacterized protein CANTADRAFT_6552 [Suhomyces tanzawaensis NRRL Y-17324]|uniref:Uncharacterized protein n=1 Tax=Suhomyces tanzawaensis NRRL Y-17324 TaxID=984487 RepID=A0A1E4SIT9_9ASCO|nr:uncharacterized protein CANTADRAFT_6552 [Suhomyces tanzawaensis NRRL Y-17324]ODV79426.1 hypothetical protein CANTADRAFT_6552 [Suhomyces tanzawaensis NRRL Y-17324]
MESFPSRNGMSSASTTVAVAGLGTSIPLDNQRLQAYKGIMNKFYMHKSFDVLSDMEFLPAIPGDGSVLSTPTLSPPLLNTPVASPSFQYNRMNEYHGHKNPNRVSYPGNGDMSSTPKTRMAYMAQSPKRTPPNPNAMPMRRRVVSANQQAQYSHDYNTIDHSYMVQNRINQYGSRNW